MQGGWFFLVKAELGISPEIRESPVVISRRLRQLTLGPRVCSGEFYLPFSLKWRKQSFWISNVSRLGSSKCIYIQTLFCKALGSYVDSALGSWKVKTIVLFNLVLESLWTSRDVGWEKPHPLLSSLLFCFFLPMSTRIAGKGRGETRKVSLLLSNIDLDCRRELLQSTVHKHIFGITSSSASQYPPSGQNSLKG